MKKLQSISAIIIAVIIGLSFTACKKKGDTGPQGPTGATGAPGNANVVGTTTTAVSSWTSFGATWTSTVAVPGITQSVLDKGIVTVFVQYSPEWWSLPDINGINSTQYGFGLGYVSFYNSNSDSSTPANPGQKVFRIVVVTPSNKAANPNVNWNDYDEVKKTLKLQE